MFAWALPLLTILALASSAIKPLSGESLSLALLRVESLRDVIGFPEREMISAGRVGLPWNSAQMIAERLTDLTFFSLGEKGVLGLQLVLLAFTSLALFNLSRRLSHSVPIALIATALSSIAIWGDTRDLTGAFGVLLAIVEIRFLIVGWFFRALVLLLLHPFFDASYLVVPCFFLLAARRPLRSLRLKDASLLVAIAFSQAAIFGVELRYQTDFTVIACSLLVSALAILLSRSPLPVLAVLLLGFLQYALQTPAVAMAAPILVAAQWRRNHSGIQERLNGSLKKGVEAFRPLFSGRNVAGVVFLLGAFIFFNLATIRNIVDEAHLPRTIVDKLADSSTLPLHSPDIGGYLGLRLNSTLPKGQPRNLFDTGPVRFAEYQFLSQLRRLFESTDINRVRSSQVLCRGSNRLCAELRKSWVELSTTELPKVVEQQLQALDPEKQKALRARVEQTRYFLLERP